MLPKELIIMGKRWKVEYTKDMVDTDIHRRTALWGQTDFFTHTFRIYVGEGKAKLPKSEVVHTLLHEIFHAVMKDNQLIKASLKTDVREEAFVDQLAAVIADTLGRNGMVRF